MSNNITEKTEPKHTEPTPFSRRDCMEMKFSYTLSSSRQRKVNANLAFKLLPTLYKNQFLWEEVHVIIEMY